jgi:hypothetical protein
MTTRFWTAFLCCAARSRQRLNSSTSGAVAGRFGSPQHHSLSLCLSVTHFISLSTSSLSPKLSSWSWVIRSSTSVVSHSFVVLYSSGFCVVISRTLTVPFQVLVHVQDVYTCIQLFPGPLSSECFFPLQITSSTIAPLFLLHFLPSLTVQWKTCRFFL